MLCVQVRSRGFPALARLLQHANYSASLRPDLELHFYHKYFLSYVRGTQFSVSHITFSAPRGSVASKRGASDLQRGAGFR